jgi:hypothetical protein
VGTQYRLRYYQNCRGGQVVPNLQVTVGGVVVVGPHAVPAVGGTFPYVQKTSAAFTATATDLEVAFVTTGPGSYAVVLDQVEIGQNLVVTSLADSGVGSLRQAVLDAPPGSIITFDVGARAVISLSGQITLDKVVQIVGPGETQLTIRNILPQSFTSRIFRVTAGPVAISGLTVAGGNLPGSDIFEASGAGILSGAGALTLTDVTIKDCYAQGAGSSSTSGNSGYGGGVSGGVVTLNHCTLSNNQATFGGGAEIGTGAINNTVIDSNTAAQGGGVQITLGSISNSTISNNLAAPPAQFGEGGGGIYMRASASTLTVSNSTISGNKTFGNNIPVHGAGIFVRHAGGSDNRLTLINSTVTNGSFEQVWSAGSIGTTSQGSGIYVTGGTLDRNRFTTRNSIISGNVNTIRDNLPTQGDRGTPDIAAAPVSQGYNLFGSINAFPGTVTGDQTGDLRSLPSLTPLGFFGGAAYTHAPLSDSVAINAGNTATSPVLDQRGAARVGIADIGAFEVNNTANGGTYRVILPKGILTVTYTAVTLVPNVKYGSVFTYTVTSGALPGGMSLVTRLVTEPDGTVTSGVVTIEGAPTTAGTFDFAITAANGSLTNVTNYRIVVPANPSVTAIAPSSGNPGGGETVTITGASFTDATNVTIGGTPVLSFTVVSDTSIVAVTPPHAFGPASVVVRRGVSNNAPNTLFTYLATLYTQPQYDAQRITGRNDVINAPNTYNLYTAAQYTGNYTAGQNNVINSPNSFNLYTLAQIQTLNVGTPLLVKDSATGNFKLTIGVKKTANLATTPFADFPMNGAGMSSVINAQGKLEFVFPVTDNAAFFRLESSP